MAEKVGLEFIQKTFTGLSKGMKSRVGNAIVKVREDTRSALMTESPVGKTGNFRSSWEAASDVSPGESTIAAASVWNPIIYAEPLEAGSRRGARPWPSAGPRTKEKDGRIWSSQAVGGVINQVLTAEYINDMAEAVNDAAFRGL
jgi:hypothetical protein